MTNAVKKFPLNQVDLLILNETEGADLTGVTSPYDILNKIKKRYPRPIIILTLGKHGILAWDSEKYLRQKAKKVKVVDTTGAGDTFNAAFLAATLRGKPLATRLRFANAAAALSVTVLGPRGLLPTWDEVESFLKEVEDVEKY